MSIPPDGPAAVEPAAREHLRGQANPFGFVVVAPGTEEESAAFDVPELHDALLADLRTVIGRYRDGKPPTQVFPVLGPAGSGKTHLLNRLAGELTREAEATGAEAVILPVGKIRPKLDGIDYLYRLFVNHILAARGPGPRTLDAVAARTAARVLSQAVRQLPPHKQLDLFPAPPTGWWGKIVGAKPVDRKDDINIILAACDRPKPTATELRQVWVGAGLAPAVAVELVADFAQRNGSKDAAGWMRKELYTRLATLVFLADRGPFEELHTGEIAAPPTLFAAAATATADGVLLPRPFDRYLLTAWLELLDEHNIPVVLAFDQIEDDIRRATPEEEAEAFRDFSRMLTGIVSNVPDVCIFVFAESSLWNNLLNRSDVYARDRLAQVISLPGPNAKTALDIPTRLTPELLAKVIRRRMESVLPAGQFPGLPDIFPFASQDLVECANAPTMRSCLRELGKRYDEWLIDKPVGPDPILAFRKQLESNWRSAMRSVRKEYDGVTIGASTIPLIQSAIDGLLRATAAAGATGTGPWAAVELLHDTSRGQYGYLNLIRPDDAAAPGVGIGAWLALSPHNGWDMRQRLAFLSDDPAAVRTLILLRPDGKDGLTGSAAAAFEEAKEAGRDVRIVKLDDKRFHTAVAFERWREQAVPELDAPDLADRKPEATAVYNELVTGIAREWVAWVDSWRKPKGKV